MTFKKMQLVPSTGTGKLKKRQLKKNNKNKRKNKTKRKAVRKIPLRWQKLYINESVCVRVSDG
jgi:hypothetical protein